LLSRGKSFDGDGIRTFVYLGEGHHSFFEVGERRVFQGRLFGGLLDEKVFGFEDFRE
jgi:hypothetical protein